MAGATNDPATSLTIGATRGAINNDTRTLPNGRVSDTPK